METREVLLGDERIGFYDIVVHTLASFFLAPVFYIVLARAEVRPT